jgi:hypothetical protein
MSSEEENVQSKSINVSKINRLKNEIKSLRGKYENIRQEAYEKKKKILASEDTYREKHPGVSHPISAIRREGKQVVRKVGGFKERVNPPSEGPWFVLVKYKKDGTWELQGTYNTEQERDNAVNDIKTKIHNRKGNYSDYYVTSNLREVQRFLKVSRYKETKHHAELRKEISRLPTGRWSENVQTGLQVPEEKQISREIGKYSGYSSKPSGMMPRMTVGVFGSMSQPKRTNLPSFVGTQTRTKQPVKIKKTVLPHDQYKELLDSGYTREQLEENGVVDKFSRYYQEESVFPGCVSYRPVGYHQSFLNRKQGCRTNLSNLLQLEQLTPRQVKEKQLIDGGPLDGNKIRFYTK